MSTSSKGKDASIIKSTLMTYIEKEIDKDQGLKVIYERIHAMNLKLVSNQTMQAGYEPEEYQSYLAACMNH